MIQPSQRRYRQIGLAAILIGVAAASGPILRSTPAEAQNGAAIQSAIGGPVRLMRGQTARVAAFMPTALRGAPKRVDLKFAINMVGEMWTVRGATFTVDEDCPGASIELGITLNGDVVFQKEVIGRL